MTDTIGEITYYARQEGTVWTFTPAPDPRDAHIAELVAQLNACDVLLDSERKLHERSRLRVLELEEDRESAHRFGAINHERAERADSRIAELEAVLKNLRAYLERDDRDPYPAKSDFMMLALIDVVLRPLPSLERDMTIISEEVNA